MSDEHAVFNGAPAPLLLCTGSLNIDIIASVPELPQRDGRVTAQPFEKQLGGMASNAACGAAALCDRWSHRVILVASIGSDLESQWAEDELIGRGIDIKWVDRDSLASTPRCFILVEPDGARTIVTEPTQLNYKYIDDCVNALQSYTGQKLLYAEGHHLLWMQDQIARARTSGWRIAADIDGMPLERFTLGLLEDISQSCDYVFVNRGYAERLFDMSSLASDSVGILHLQTLAKRSNTLFLLTLGADGAMIVQPQGEVMTVPTIAVEVKDSTGAGDIFAGVFCAACLQNLLPRQAVAYATLAATLSTVASGAIGYVPTAGRLEAMLLKNDEV